MNFSSRIPTLMGVLYAVPIVILTLSGGIPLYNKSATFDSFPVFVYILGALGLSIFAVLKGHAEAVRYTVFIFILFLYYYLFMHRNSPDLKEVYSSLRTIYLLGFVILFVVHGLMVLGLAVKYRETAEDFQKNAPYLVQYLILTIFSYGIISIISQWI